MGVVDDEIDRDRGFPGPRPHVRLGALGEAWGLFLDRWVVWVLASLIYVLGYSAVTSVALALFRVPGPVGGGFRVPLPPGGQTLTILLSAVITGFFLGGLFRMACRQVRGEWIRLRDLFDIADVLPELFIGSVLYFLAIALGFMVCIVPGLLAAGVLMFTVPLIVDGRLTATEAIRQSWYALKGEWLNATLVHLVFWLISGLGACCCGMGLLLTAPLYSLSIAVLYRDFFLAKPFPYAGKPFPPRGSS